MGLDVSELYEPHYCPILIGKDAVPRVLTLEHAIARPELATLSAIVHQHDDVDRQLARHAIASARFIEPQRARANVRALLNCLEEAAMNELRATPEYRDTIDE